MERYDCLEGGMTVDARAEDGRVIRVTLDRVVRDVVFADDLQTADRSYLARAEDGRWVLYQDYPEDESQGYVFEDERLIAPALSGDEDEQAD